MDLRKYLDEFNKGGDGKPRGLPLFEAVDIMLQIAQGMRYLHDGRMMHRDLKSKNVLVNVIRSPDSRVSSSVLQVKVTDFGLAKLTDNSRFTTRDVGTTRWRAPEVFGEDNNPGKYKKSADVYSFAMVFFEVLTGEIPFDGISLSNFLQKLHRGLRPRLPRNECPKYLSALVKKCWSRNAARRPTFATICKTLVNCKVAILAAQSPSPRNILSYDSDDESRTSPSRLCSNCHFLL
jgi:serine/threonine protein kinase